MWRAHKLMSIMKITNVKNSATNNSLIKFIKVALDVNKQKEIKGGNIIIEEAQIG